MSSNSNIKGGGRASLSDAAETALIDCLMKRRRRPLNSKNRGSLGAAADLSSASHHHDLKRERKRFVKRLVETYARERAQQQVNGITNIEDEIAPASSKKPAVTTTLSGAPATNVTGKVRVELVEAVFSDDNHKKMKESSSNKKKSKQQLRFKSGSKKVVVLPKATTIPELLTLAQNKLRMKKNKPTRIFVLLGDSQQQVNLETNLAGITDGTSLYVTSTDKDDDYDAGSTQENGSAESTSSTSKALGTNLEDTGEIPPGTAVDPLDAVKRAYFKQHEHQEQKRRKRRRPSSTNHPPFPVPHPTFSDHFESLAPLSELSSKLPAADRRLEILQAVQDHRVVVICGATGCGKSTQVPQFLWQGLHASSCGKSKREDDGHPPYAQILVTQPRRVAATALARRVSQEMECPLPGQPDSLVGHHVRLDRAISDTAQIVYCTVGILLRRMTSPHSTTSYDDQPHKSSPSPLSEFTHIVVDEVHERDVQTDFLLTLLLRVALPRNPHLRVILMSATASSQLFMDYFAAFRPCVLAIPGRTFPVETMWLEDCQRFAASQIQNYHDTLKEETEEEIMRPSKETSSTTTRLSPRATDVIDYVFIQSLIVSILRKQQADGDLHAKSNNTGDTNHRVNGAILVFLPGKAEIEALFRIMVRGTNDLPLSKDSLKLYKLHSGIPRGSQQVVFDPAPGGTVKIVLATNIAETSITIPDVSHVIDTGRVKESRYNPSSRIKELVTVWTSHASAKQRAGRAGRTTAGACYKLYSQSFSEAYLLTQTPPEMIRTPLDELILQLCLMYEQRRDELSPEGRADNNFPKGANPLQFLSQVPEPPPTASLEQACQHLLDVDALHVVDGSTSTTGSPLLYRLTPLGFHLSRLPMDAKVGKTLIVGCILECLEGALTIAATLSSSKSCFYSKFGKSPIVDRDYELAVEARARLIESGFGGNGWRGGTVKGDLITAIACYREWEKRSNDKERFDFACKNALDHTALKEIQELRKQYLELLVDAGFVSSHSASSWATPVRHARSKNTKQHLSQNQFQDDALLTSCCLVAGMYPNVCTLMRPRKGGPKGGRLLTKEGDVCRPQMQSFQRPRVQKAAETGKDAYAVYHNKHRSLGTGNRPGEVFLSEVNFVSRYALLLFSGELEIVKNAIVLDGWLKFKIGEKSVAGAVLLLALRDELDQSLLQKISRENDTNCEDDDKQDEEINELMNVVRQLLAEE